MTALVIWGVLLLVALLAPRFGADSRDGRDWQPWQPLSNRRR